MENNCTCMAVVMTYFRLRKQDVCTANSKAMYQEFVMRIAFNLAAAFVSSAVIMLAVI